MLPHDYQPKCLGWDNLPLVLMCRSRCWLCHGQLWPARGPVSKGRMSSRRNEADVRRREGMGNRASCYLLVLDSSIFWIPMDRWPWVYWDLLCPYRVCMLSLQSCPTLCDPMDCSPPGSSVHEIFQARILEWVAMPSSRSSWPGDQTCISFISCIGRWVLYH